jgi:acetyl-CoA acetyltransferase
MQKFEDDVIISGIGQSDVGRRLGRSPLQLTVDAISQAVADAGLAIGDIGALVSYPGGGISLGGPGFAGPSLMEVCDTMGLEVDLLMGNFEGPAQLGPIVNAALAISSGSTRHAVVYRTVTEGSARAAGQRYGAGGIDPGPVPWITGFGGGPAPIGYALLARRHFHEYGTTRQQLGQIALTARRHAALNPKALFREPLTIEDYLGARMIADPLCLYDCDVYCDGSTALVLSHVSHAPDGAGAPVHIEAIGTAPAARPDYAQHLEIQPGRRAAKQMWSRTDLRPRNVAVAEIYDGFSILTLLWLEALGFCGPGESGPFVADAERISLGGALPMNTNGGQLSAGRLHGLGFVHEACLQLRGQAGERQVDEAGVAVVSVGALPYVGCMLLRAANG